jgi:quinohemoprotein ethanol dehydrogenase
MQAKKNAFFYVLDRITGEFISAEAFAPFNWATGIDPKTGRPMVRPEANYGLQPIIISPGPGGAHNWSPMAFSAQTGLVYIPTTFGSQITYSVNPVNFVFREGRANTGTGGMATPGRGAPPPAPAAPGAEPVHPGTEPVVTPAAPTLLPMLGPQGGRGGYLVAWDPVAQKERWRSQGGGSMGGGVMTTAGNLVFQVLPDGRLIAFSADKGEKLLEVQTPHRVGMGPPMTYMVGGRQYVTLMGGRGAGGFGRGGPAGPPPAGAPPPPPAAAPAPAAGGFGSPPQVLTYAVSGAN